MSNSTLTLADILDTLPAGAFATALRFTLEQEGVGSTDASGNPRGPVCCGIFAADYDAYRQENGLPQQDVRQIAAEEVIAIYKGDYWAPLRGDDLPEQLAIVLFDTAVNVGVVRTVRWLQKALGVAVDGCFGQNTAAALDVYVSRNGTATLTGRLLAQRAAYYNALGSWAADHKAEWLSRCRTLAELAGAELPA